MFGLLKEESIDETRGYIDQLIAHELLQQSGEQYPVLQLTAAGAALLRDPAGAPDADAGASDASREKGRGPARREPKPSHGRASIARCSKSSAGCGSASPANRGVPPYVIFHDTTLRELARLKPMSIEALRHVYGVGARKAEDLGDAVIELIRGGAPDAGAEQGTR